MVVVVVVVVVFPSVSWKRVPPPLAKPSKTLPTNHIITSHQHRLLQNPPAAGRRARRARAALSAGRGVPLQAARVWSLEREGSIVSIEEKWGWRRRIISRIRW
ncbi:unnamed protein product, partial [Laminaria digitata]